MNETIFREQYRVVAVESERLIIRGVVTGNILTITNPTPGTELKKEDYPPGQLIALCDPAKNASDTVN